MIDTTQLAPAEDLRAQAIALLEEAIAILDQLKLGTHAARLDHIIEDVRVADLTNPTH